MFLRMVGEYGPWLTGHVHTNAGLDNNGIAFFSLTSRGLPFIEVMAGFEYTVEQYSTFLYFIQKVHKVQQEDMKIKVWKKRKKIIMNN